MIHPPRSRMIDVELLGALVGVQPKKVHNLLAGWAEGIFSGQRGSRSWLPWDTAVSLGAVVIVGPAVKPYLRQELQRAAMTALLFSQGPWVVVNASKPSVEPSTDPDPLRLNVNVRELEAAMNERFLSLDPKYVEKHCVFTSYSDPIEGADHE